MRKVLVVDASDNDRQSITNSLEQSGFECLDARTWAQGRDIGLSEPGIALAVVELYFDSEPVTELYRALLEQAGLPVIVVSGSSIPADRVVALEMGCSDFILKPFDGAELAARSRAAIRRYRRDEDPANRTRAYRCGRLTVDLDHRRVFDDQLSVVEMSFKEFSAFSTLLESRGEIVAREELYKAVYSTSFDPLNRKLDMLIAKVRRKLPKKMIETVRGEGFRIRSSIEPLDEPVPTVDRLLPSQSLGQRA